MAKGLWGQKTPSAARLSEPPSEGTGLAKESPVGALDMKPSPEAPAPAKMGMTPSAAFAGPTARSPAGGEGTAPAKERSRKAKLPSERLDERLCVSLADEEREDLRLAAWIEDLPESAIVRQAIREWRVRHRATIERARMVKGQVAEGA